MAYEPTGEDKPAKAASKRISAPGSQEAQQVSHALALPKASGVW